MPFDVTAMVLLAAVLHAGWNALLRAGSDRLWSMTIMGAAIALTSAPLTLLLPVPSSASWSCVALSALLHVGYNLFLVRTYRSGDLGQMYPIARGVSPLLIALGASLFAGEFLDLLSLTGATLVSLGITCLAFEHRRLDLDTLPYALATGCFIGAYSVVDGIGARLSGTPAGYTIWMCLFWGALMIPVYVTARDWRSLFRGLRQTSVAASGGVISLTAYGTIIWAMSLGPMAMVSALRETSVVFAAVMGRVFLSEHLTWHRIAACAVVALGAYCIGYQHPLQR